jgi:hypothetical protein
MVIYKKFCCQHDYQQVLWAMMRYIFLKERHVSVHACNEKIKGPGFDS